MAEPALSLHGELTVFVKPYPDEVSKSVAFLDGVLKHSGLITDDLEVHIIRAGLYVVSLSVLSEGVGICSVADGDTIEMWFPNLLKAQQFCGQVIALGVPTKQVECVDLMS